MVKEEELRSKLIDFQIISYDNKQEFYNNTNKIQKKINMNVVEISKVQFRLEINQKLKNRKLKLSVIIRFLLDYIFVFQLSHTCKNFRA